jgi:hypothetical protein
MRVVKSFPILAIAVALLTTSCTTLENRRYLWEYQKVEGPYTRMLAEKAWPWPRQNQPVDALQTVPEKPWGK